MTYTVSGGALNSAQPQPNIDYTVQCPLPNLSSIKNRPMFSLRYSAACTLVKFAASFGHAKAKRRSASGGFAPLTPTGGSAPGPPLGAHTFRARHGSHVLCSCKLTLKKALIQGR